MKIKRAIIGLVAVASALCISPAYGTLRILTNGQYRDQIYMRTGDFVSIEIYSDDTTMYTAWFYYAYDGGYLIHDDIHSPTPEAGADAFVVDYPDPDFFYGLGAYDFGLMHVYPGIHFVFDYTANDIGLYCLELYDEDSIVVDILDFFIGAYDGDLTPPTPNPMTWSSAPAPLDHTSITMTATTASDACAVQYAFDCVSGGCHDSGWQDQTTYTDSNLMPNVEYTYRVKARDKSLNVNETNWSNQASARLRGIIYVDVNATGANNGSNWEDAYKYLQDALNAAGSGADIWVAQGTYRPDEDTNNPGGTGSQVATFQLANNLAIYGGFPTGGGIWSSRDPNVYKTILSGDLAGNDGPNFANNGENSYHVVTGSDTDSTAILDGFTITAGNADEWPDYEGGGMLNVVCSPTIDNCIFSGNSAHYFGGMYNDSSNPSLTNCTFSGNSAVSGGGMGNIYGSPLLTNCTFSGNCIGGTGGGMINEFSSPTLLNCTFTGNSAYNGAGIYDWRSSSIFINCTVSGNSVQTEGGGIFSVDTSPTLTNCIFSGNSANSGDGIFACGSSIIKVGASGSVSTADEFYFKDGSQIQGTGSIVIELGGEMIIDSNAVVDLSDPCDPEIRGTIHCDGLLQVKDNAILNNTDVNISRQAGGYYGKFQVEDSATVINLGIYTDGDRFMDVDPCSFTGIIANNYIYVTITEGQNGMPEGALEVRGRDFNEPPCGPNEPACQIDGNTMPSFDTDSWTLERLEVAAGAKVTLVDRFNSGNGDPEVLYVKDLVLGADCNLNVGFERLYYTNLAGDPNSILKAALLGLSLDKMDCDSNEEFQSRVSNNNFTHPTDPNLNRIQIERVVGLEPDPNGMMIMRNVEDEDGNMISARAKAEFAPAVEDEIRIRLNYLFLTSDPCAQIVVYLSDVPELLSINDPCRAFHYIEVARISNPPVPRPGSVGSGRYGNFDKYVSTGALDLSLGTWIELELIESGQSQILAYGGYNGMRYHAAEGGEGDAGASVDDWDAGIYCYWGICLDLNWDMFVNEADFLIVVSGAGSTDAPCLDGGFSEDGYADSYDTASWDWTLNLDGRENLCGQVPLSEETGFSAAGGFGQSGSPVNLLNFSDLNDLLICGKRGTTDAATKLKDRLYVFDSNYHYIQLHDPVPYRYNIRIVRGSGNDLYQLNSQNGLLLLDDAPIVPPGQTTCPNEPRYNEPATIYVGVQGTGEESFGRAILDAAFDAGFVYVVPVVVVPSTSEPYTAAAKLALDQQSNPPYHVVELYDGPVLPGDNQLEYRNNLRDIELDEAGNVYVINANIMNESDILWKFEPNGSVHRLDLGNPNGPCYLRAPAGMCVSSATNVLYLASSLNCQTDPNAAVIRGLSTTTLAPVRTITVSGMQHITSITEDATTNSLWVAGFRINSRPNPPNPYALPFYDPYLAKVPPGANNVSAVCILASDLAMPLSIVWTGARPEQELCGGADLSGNGNVNLPDLAMLAQYWLSKNCAVLDNCHGADLEPEQIPDGDVDLYDLDIFAEHWLDTGCLGP